MLHNQPGECQVEDCTKDLYLGTFVRFIVQFTIRRHRTVYDSPSDGLQSSKLCIVRDMCGTSK